MSCYSRLIGRWPHVVLPIVILVVIACAMVAILVYPYPDLSDPLKGFEARGTSIKGRELVVYNLRDLSKTDLTEIPTESLPPEVLADPAVVAVYRGFAGQLAALLGSLPGGALPDWRDIPPEDARNGPGTSERSLQVQEGSNTSTCKVGILEFQPKVVFASQSGGTLLTKRGLRSLCNLETRLMPDPGCRARVSFLYYLELLRGGPCEALGDADIEYVLELLRTCAPFYHSGELTEACSAAGECPSVPAQCKQHDAVYNILHYATDDQFFGKPSNQGNNSSENLTFALFSTPLDGITDKEYYYMMFGEGADLTDANVYVRGVDSLIKFDLFNDFLLRDMMFFGLAMLLILIAMCLYLRSFFVTIATVLNVVFTLILAYVIYRFVGIKHFPFMNVLTGLICIAIGADDVFIFFDTWQQVKAEHPDGDIQKWMALTFHHAALSIFVTSLTTASAFLANIVSEITDVQCFGIFSGIAILCNFLFMMTWVPSVIVAIEYFGKENCKYNKGCRSCKSCAKGIGKLNIIFEKFLPYVVRTTYFVWLIVLFLLGAGGIFAVFVLPRLELPSSKEFQVFQPTDPLERWDIELKHKFRYYQQSDANAQNSFGLPIMAVWGFDEKDKGSSLDPDDHGRLVQDKTFSMSSPEGQVWMEDFCTSFTNSSLILPALAPIPCTLTVFNRMMALPCVHKGISPCCNQTSPPFEEDLFNRCFPLLTNVLAASINLKTLPTYGQTLYNKNTGAIAGYMLTALGTQTWSPIIDVMQVYDKDLQDFMSEETKSAPAGVERGFITSYFKFYDLQRALSSGTYVAIGVSVAVAFVVMFLTSLNILITIFALFTIILTIAVTVGSLVLLGWELNILESVTISLAVGLSIDFTIHYGVAYRLCPSENRIEKVRESFQRVGSPVAMAAFTTFIAGAAIMPAKVLAYTQLGVFLMLVMAISWVYSTFFFQSLCRILGPKKTAECSSCCHCCRKKDEDEKVHPNTWDLEQNNHTLEVNPGSVEGLSNSTNERAERHNTTSLCNGSHLINGQANGEVRPAPEITEAHMNSAFQANSAYVADT